MSDIKNLEHPTLKVPYEMLNKRFRSSQKSIEKEISSLNGKLVVGDIEKSLSSGSFDPRTDIDNIVKSIDNFNHQVRKAVDHEMEVAENCQVGSEVGSSGQTFLGFI